MKYPEDVLARAAKEQERWYVAKSAHSSLPYRDILKDSEFEYFLPTRFVVQEIGGRRVRVERPVVFNFIFLRGKKSLLKYFLKFVNGIHLVYRHLYMEQERNTEDNLLVAVGDEEMRMFAQTIGAYYGDVPFVKPSEVNLQKGDHVRITDGPFVGVEGVLLSQQGKDGGRVLVSISDLIAVPTLDIEPEYLQILSCATAGKHMYKKFDSFMKKASKALQHHLTNKFDSKDATALMIFLKRFGTLQTHTVNSHAKLLVYLLICHTCLENKEGRETVEVQLNELLSNVNSEQFRALALVNLYACTGRDSYRKEAEEIITEWGTPEEKEKAKLAIIKDFSIYSKLLDN